MSLSLREIEIPQKEIYTYADYALLPEGAPYQLIGGKLIMTPAPATYHQAVSMRLGVKMAWSRWKFCKAGCFVVLR